MIVERIGDYFSAHPILLGGPGVIVQIDETKLDFNVKSHRGHSSITCWALCMMDTSFTPSLEYVTIVEDRKTETLMTAIDSVILPGTIIYTDEWAAYNKLGESGVYSHKTVCHKYNFVNPNTGVHTKNVESYNNKLKSRLKNEGVDS